MEHHQSILLAPDLLYVLRLRDGRHKASVGGTDWSVESGYRSSQLAACEDLIQHLYDFIEDEREREPGIADALKVVLDAGAIDPEDIKWTTDSE
jgi:hypothetical protein